MRKNVMKYGIITHITLLHKENKDNANSAGEYLQLAMFPYSVFQLRLDAVWLKYTYCVEEPYGP